MVLHNVPTPGEVSLLSRVKVSSHDVHFVLSVRCDLTQLATVLGIHTGGTEEFKANLESHSVQTPAVLNLMQLFLFPIV
jgi:hypothetical protein